MSSLLEKVFCVVLGAVITEIAALVVRALGFEAGGMMSILETDGDGFSATGHVILSTVGGAAGVVVGTVIKKCELSSILTF